MAKIRKGGKPQTEYSFDDLVPGTIYRMVGGTVYMAVLYQGAHTARATGVVSLVTGVYLPRDAFSKSTRYIKLPNAVIDLGE